MTRPLLNLLLAAISVVTITNTLQAQVTYHADIAAIMNNSCVVCHRPGELGPMPLTNYTEVAANADLIEWATATKSMPPWTPDPTYTHFVGERVLTEDEIETISAWVDGGAIEGDPADNPGDPVFPEGSAIGEPDLVLTMAEPYVHGGDMTDQYQVFLLPTDLPADQAIKAIEVRTQNGAICHHAIIGIDTGTESQVLDAADPAPGYESFGGFGFNPYASFFAGWVPGTTQQVYPPTIGRVIPQGATLLLQMHYAPTTMEQSDQTSVNIFFADEAIEREAYTFMITPSDTDNPFFIPANTTPTFHAAITVDEDVSVMNVVPHCHLLGDSWLVYAVSPDATDTIPLISIPAWDFHWQGFFTFPHIVKIPAGYTLHSYGSYDNTSANDENPNDPPALVMYGEGTGDEMYFVFFDIMPYQEGDELISMEFNAVTEMPGTSASDPLFTLYPNPTSSQLTIDIDPALLGTAWTLSDMTGRAVSGGRFSELRSSLKLGSLPAGIYTLHTSSSAQRLVVE